MSNIDHSAILRLYGALIDVYYVLLALNLKVIRPLKIMFKGHELEIPVELAIFAKAVHEAEKYLRQLERILMNPSRILEEKIVISNTVEGTLNIPLTSKYLSRGIRLVAYSKRKLTYASPENLLLKAFYLRLYKDIEQLKDKLVGLGYDKSRVLELYAKKLIDNIEAFTKRLNKVGRLSILKEIVVEPRLLKCNELRHLAKVVLRRRHKLYHEIARQAIEYCMQIPKVELISKSIKENILEGQKLGLWDYKLYEVYSYYIVAVSLENILGTKTQMTLINRTLIYRLGNSKYQLLYDEPVECSSWLGHGKLIVDSAVQQEITPGRPDISLVKTRETDSENKVLIVIDAKYTKSYSYISQSRYKILGYQNEYNTRLGALIFSPSVLVDSEIQDQEDMDFKNVLIEVISRGGGKIVNDKYKLYLIPIDPQPYEKTISSKSYQLLLEALKESLKT